MKKLDLDRFTPVKDYFVAKNSPKPKEAKSIILLEDTQNPEDKTPYAELQIVKCGPGVLNYTEGDIVLVSWNHCFNNPWKEEEGEGESRKLVTHYLLKEDMILFNTK